MKDKKLKKELKSIVELKEILKNPSPKVKVPLYTEIEVIQTTINSGDDTVKKSTLSQRMDRLETTVITMDKRMDRLETMVTTMDKRMGRLETTINKLAKIVSDGFKQVNSRLDNVEKRLDYIVSANNLKDLPKNKKI